MITLCQDCHDDETQEIRSAIYLLTREVRAKFLAAEILDIAAGFNAMELQHVPGVVASAIGWALWDAGMQAEIVERYLAALGESRRQHLLEAKA